jgi:hypothetical protein
MRLSVAIDGELTCPQCSTSFHASCRCSSMWTSDPSSFAESAQAPSTSSGALAT